MGGGLRFDSLASAPLSLTRSSEILIMRLAVQRIARLGANLPGAAGAIFLIAIWIAGPLEIRAADAAVDVASEVTLPCETVLRIHGSTTIGVNLMQDLLIPFLKQEGWTALKKSPADDGASYTVVGHPPGSDKLAGAYVEISDPESALTALDQGFADIAMCSRRIRPAEIRQLTRLGDMTSPSCEHVLALDAVAVIVNAANPVESLTRLQLKDIFLRHTVSWQDVGGQGPIHLYARDPKSGTCATFQSTILEDEDFSPDALRFADNRALAEAVAADPRGIGFVAVAFAGTNRIVAVSNGKPELPSIRPVASAIRNGEYLLSRRLFLYTGAVPENPLAQRFVTFAMANTGQAIVAQSGFLSPSAEPAVPREPATALASSPPLTPPPAAPEGRPNPTPPPARTRARLAEPPPVATPRPRAEAAPPKPTPTPRPPRPAATRPQSTPAAAPGFVPDQFSNGTGG
jgi:ABC-type phosphate transport system substrate-binding protein